MRLFLAFIAIPLIEIALFIQVGGLLGLWPTLAIVVLTAILGSYLLRTQGTAVLRQLQDAMSQFNDPSGPLAHGAMILFAGALLLTPGFFTDVVGLSLMVPGVRQFVYNFVRSRMTTSQGQSAQRPSSVIDAEYVDVTEPNSDSPWTKE